MRRHGVAIRCSTRADGDFHPRRSSIADVHTRRRAFVDLPWTMLDQVHGTNVVTVSEPVDADGVVGDVAITSEADTVLGCWVADCAPLVLIGARQFAVVHAGWRGLAAGVVDAAFDAFTEPVVAAVLGPAIGPCCYEFGSDDLRAVADAVGVVPDVVTGRTSQGSPALDVPAAVAAACRRRRVSVEVVAGCTGCSHDGFSHRVRRDPERHVVAAWRPHGGTP